MEYIETTYVSEAIEIRLRIPKQDSENKNKAIDYFLRGIIAEIKVDVELLYKSPETLPMLADRRRKRLP